MTENNFHPADTQRDGGLDIIHSLQPQKLPPDQAGHAGPPGNPDDQHHMKYGSLLYERHDSQDEEKHRKTQHDFHKARYKHIHFTAEISSQRTQHYPDGHIDGNSHHANRQGDSGAVNHSGEHVTPGLVRTEPVVFVRGARVVHTHIYFPVRILAQRVKRADFDPLVRQFFLQVPVVHGRVPDGEALKQDESDQCAQEKPPEVPAAPPTPQTAVTHFTHQPHQQVQRTQHHDQVEKDIDPVFKESAVKQGGKERVRSAGCVKKAAVHIPGQLSGMFPRFHTSGLTRLERHYGFPYFSLEAKSNRNRIRGVVTGPLKRWRIIK